MVTTRSYARPAGNWDAANASVSPSPAPSRSAEYASAMNHDVPQPVTATRSPGPGRPSNAAAASAARRQQAGCVAISAAVRDMRRGSSGAGGRDPTCIAVVLSRRQRRPGGPVPLVQAL
jgi:hypothetical protein